MTEVQVADRVSAIVVSVMGALTVFGVASFMHFAISKDDLRKQIQGRPIRYWVAVLFLVGACYGAYLGDNSQYYLQEVVFPMGGFGLVAGIVIGNLHGAFNLYRYSKAQQRSISVDSTSDIEEDSDNPYQPPQSL